MEANQTLHAVQSLPQRAKEEADQPGLAMTEDGKLAPMPRDLAHSIVCELLDVVGLVHSTKREIEDCNGGGDEDGTTDAPSRAQTLLRIVDSRLRAALREMSPYA